MAAALKLFRHTMKVLALGTCVGLGSTTAFGEQALPAAPSLEELRQLFAERSGSSRSRAARSRTPPKAGRDEHAWRSRHATSWRRCARSRRSVGAGGGRGAPRVEQDVHRFPELAEQR
jgi:hypothetical protein